MSVDLVLIPGWGCDSTIWQPVLPYLSNKFRVQCIELSLDVDALKQQIPCGSIVVGWSLGGLLASEVAIAYPQWIHGLITIGTNPCFVRQHDWPGVARDRIQEMLTGFAQDRQKILRRFYQLIFQGSCRHHQEFIECCHKSEALNLSDLELGLKKLRDTDLRKGWQHRVVVVHCHHNLSLLY